MLRPFLLRLRFVALPDFVWPPPFLVAAPEERDEAPAVAEREPVPLPVRGRGEVALGFSAILNETAYTIN